MKSYHFVDNIDLDPQTALADAEYSIKLTLIHSNIVYYCVL